MCDCDSMTVAIFLHKVGDQVKSFDWTTINWNSNQSINDMIAAMNLPSEVHPRSKKLIFYWMINDVNNKLPLNEISHEKHFPNLLLDIGAELNFDPAEGTRTHVFDITYQRF